jgi:transcriptional regulator with XRE-family HTH domain
MTLGEKILKNREKVCLSQVEFAHRLGMSDVKRIEIWEKNESTPDLLILDAMTKIFGVSKGWYIAKEDVSFHDFLDEVLEIRELITYIAFHGDRHFIKDAMRTLKEIKAKVIETNQKKNN